MPNTIKKASDLTIKTRSRPFSLKQKKRFTDLILKEHKTMGQACDAMGVSYHQLITTRKADPEFQKICERYKEGFANRVEDVAFDILLNKRIEVTEKWVAKFDENKEPMMDANGEPVMILKERQVRKLPASDRLIEFIATAWLRERYGANALDENTDIAANPKELKKQLTEKVKELQELKKAA